MRHSCRSSISRSTLTVERLEDRTVPAGISYDPVSQTIAIDGTDSADIVLIDGEIGVAGSEVTVTWTHDGQTDTLSIPDDNQGPDGPPVVQVRFDGRGDDDYFTNSTNIMCEAHGGA